MYLVCNSKLELADTLSLLAPRMLALGGSAEDVLTAARDRIHLGAKLLAHPMAGRLRPNETPYRTVVLEETEGPLDLSSFEIIEYCLAEEKKYESSRKKYDEPLLPDLRFINCEILKSILEELS